MYLQILNQIEITDSTNAKLALLKANASDDVLKRIYRLTYSRRLQYGIKKIPMYTTLEQNFSIEDALDFLEHRLATREITGNAAILETGNILGNMHPDDAKVIHRVLLRDLECGASRTMANKVWKNLVPEQPQMLANPCSDKTLKHIKFPAYAQLKADGSRCFAEIRGTDVSDVKLLSRAGNEYLGLDDIKLQLINASLELLEKHPGGVYIDGELVCTAAEGEGLSFILGDSSENTVSLRAQSNGIANKSLKGTISPGEADRMSYQVWDVVPLDVVYSEGKEKSEPYDKRFHELSWMFDNAHTKIIVIENTVVNSFAEARLVYNKYVDQGLEGIILKNTFGEWENKRSKNQVKFKEIIDADLEIIGVYPHSKEPNKLGGVNLRSRCGKITVNAGSGFTDTTRKRVGGDLWEDIPLADRDSLDRELLWSSRDTLIGQIAECQTNGWLTSKQRKDGTVGLFLPIIKAIRIDKEQAQTFEEIFGQDFSVTGVE